MGNVDFEGGVKRSATIKLDARNMLSYSNTSLASGRFHAGYTLCTNEEGAFTIYERTAPSEGLEQGNYICNIDFLYLVASGRENDEDYIDYIELNHVQGDHTSHLKIDAIV